MIRRTFCPKVVARKARGFMKKLCMALVAVLLRFVVAEGVASTLYFPDYVVGSGWSVQLALGNIDAATAAEVSVEVYDQGGAPIRDLFDSAAAFEIPPLGSRVLQSTGEGSLRRGWIQVRNPSTTVRGLLTYRHAETGVEVGVEPVPLGKRFALFVEDSADAGTGLAIFKPQPSAEIEFDIRDQTGRNPLQEVLTWGDFQQQVGTLPEWYEGAGDGFLGDFRGLLFLRAVDGESFAPLGLRGGKRTGSLSAVPMIPIPDSAGITLTKIIDTTTGEVVVSDFQAASNSPLRAIPLDYFPDGAVESAGWFTLPEQSTYDAGKRLFYYDYRTPGAEPEATIVLIHGNPENSYTFRDLRDALIASGRPMRIVAMDHIGFGLSDQADFEMVDMHHAENLLTLVRHLDLRDVTLAVHDWGGPIGIGAFSEEPDRVRNLVVMNTSIFPMPGEGLTYTNHPSEENPWSSTPDRISDDLWGGLAAAIILRSADEGGNLTLATLAHYFVQFQNSRFAEASPEYVFSEQFRSIANARSSKRNVRQTPVWGHGYIYVDSIHGLQDNNAFYDRMQEVVPREWGVAGRNLDASGHFGQPDPVGKAEVLAQWHEALPRMVERTFTYPDVGHFVEEVKGPEIAQSILEMNWPQHK